ncbi:hypothetical protein CEUSTIGMA_g5001.t1 [Chlamydomonas eustigma]|uniref:Uncharacterized protein n=1 Tax=Chlamydomonas eustigma TaxID=1157962 RepID=A0A250X3A6_9CHLO|nr:hypothetical protein CEUSTIGMA_g5001.t1 [Chlamydomonas eustigma]|eukprot:GAX77557.1 hypothetical protein CEUSTIGMA_g5001.t1 [Chlamydomonas eustigma]
MLNVRGGLNAHNRPSCSVQILPKLRASHQEGLNTIQIQNVRSKVVALIAEGCDQEEMAAAVKELIASCPISRDELAAKAFPLGQGTWKVFHAPHISRISSVLGAKFDPILYKLEGDKLSSYVKYSHPLVGMGWLNAAGSMGRKYDDTVDIHFDRFWLDGPETLREEIPRDAYSGLKDMDDWMSKLGRGFFFPQLALFPIHYLDEELCVFEFPPLNSKIAVQKISSAAQNSLAA